MSSSVFGPGFVGDFSFVGRPRFVIDSSGALKSGIAMFFRAPCVLLPEFLSTALLAEAIGL